MQWVLLAVVIAALLYLSRYHPKAAFGVLGTLVFAGVVIVFNTTEVGQANRSKLPTKDILIENPVISSSYGGGYRLNARLANTNSNIELKESIISVTMLDCADDLTESCQIIGQNEERINVKIPPGQARDISRTMSFDAANATGSLRWEFKITETRS